MTILGGRLRAALITALTAALLGTAAAPTGVAGAAVERELAGGALFGAQIDPITAPAFCDKLREDGSRSVSIFLSRGIIERNNGTLNTTGIDSRINPDLACGLSVGVRVKPTTDPDTKSYLPQGAELDSYLSLLTQLATYLDGRASSYAIDNESAAQAHFDGTADDYFELLRRSVAAIKAGDPDARVLDGTMASGNMTAVMVTDLYNQGRYGEAISLAQETQANELGGGAPVTDMDSLTAYVTNPRAVRSVNFFAGAVANQASYDAFQLHYYGPWRGQVEMIDYVRRNGITLPIETWEVNHRYRDQRPFVEEDFAAETARLMITSAGEGSAFTVFSSYLGNAENNAVGLFTFDGSAPHLARDSFRTITQKLTGATAAERLPVGGDAWGYLFERPNLDPIAAAWADPGPARIGDELGIDSSTALITPAGGAPSHVRLSTLEIGPTPIFAEPDLVVLKRNGKTSRKKSKLKLNCPAASLKASCSGEVKVYRALSKGTKRERAKRKQALGEAKFRVKRGETEKLKVRFDKRGLAGQAVAVTKPCTVKGKGGCKSWIDLR